MRSSALVSATFTAAAGFGLLALTTTAACESRGSDGAPATDEVTAPGTQNRETTAAAATPLTQNDCEDFGAIAGDALKAKVGEGYESVLVPLVNRPVPSRLGVLAVGNPADLVAGSAVLGTGHNDNYETCSHCLAIALDCTASDCENGTWFFPRAGTAQFTSVGASFEGSFKDVVLEQVNVDWTNGHSTPVEHGACINLPNLRFLAVAAPVKTSSSGGAPPPDGGTGEGLDGGVTASSSSTSGASSSSGAGTSGTGETSSGGTDRPPVDNGSSGTGDSSSGGTSAKQLLF